MISCILKKRVMTWRGM